MNTIATPTSDSPQSECEQTALYLLGFARVDSMPRNRILTSTEIVLSQLNLPPTVSHYLPLLCELGIECLQVGNIVAWYKRIERSDFTGDSGAANLSNLDWLTPRVLAHEAVVSKLHACFPFYPARFGCLFSSPAKLVAFTESTDAALHAFYRLIDGRQEWGVKLIGDVDQATTQMVDAALDADQQSSAGVNYLRLKQLTRKLRPVALEALEQHAAAAINELQREFRLSVVRPRSTATHPDRESLLGNVALLLTSSEANALASWSNDWQSRTGSGLSIDMRLAGPWPPYSFCPPLSFDQNQRAA